MMQLLPLFASSHDAGWSAGLIVASLIMGASSVLGGLAVWHGKEIPMIVAHQRKHGANTTPFTLMGGLRFYQTSLGGLFTAVPGGIGFILLPTAEILRLVLGQAHDGWLSTTAGYLGAVLILISFLWLTLYFWTGIPDWMRPPAQRGWELTKEGYVLARPEARVVDDFERAQIERERKEAERRARNRDAWKAEPDAWATGDDPWKDHDPWT